MPAYRSKTSTAGRNMAGARSLWRATGMKDDDFSKPIIAIANSFTQFVPGHVHLKDLGQLVAREIEAAGGVAKEFNTIAVDDGIAMGHDGMLYSLPSRDIIADSVEYMVNAHCADAIVCISNCDKITPGMLMAAMRLNIPVIFVSGGPMEAGKARLAVPGTQTIEIKNVKPFDTREFKPKMTHRRLRGADKEEGVAFEKKLSPGDKGYQAPADVYTTAANQAVWGDGASSATMGELIQRTMKDNIEHVVEDFGSNANVIQVGHNATDDLNVQKVSQDQGEDNIQAVANAVTVDANRQTIEGAVEKDNRQTLSTSSAQVNTQTLALTQVERNLQAIDSELLKDHREAVPLEARMQNLYEGIDSLNQRLNRFERENKDFLDAIRAEMLIDVAGVVVNISPEEQELLNMVDDLLRIDHVQEMPLANDEDNVQQISWDEVGDNLQQVPLFNDAENVQQIALADSHDNIQEIALARDAENIQTIGLTSATPNYQRLRDEKVLNSVEVKTQTEAFVAQTDLTCADPVVRSATGGAEANASDVFQGATSAQDTSPVATQAAKPQTGQPLAFGRYTPMGLNWLYAHAKCVIVFLLCVFAMPMNMKLPVSRAVSGVLVSLSSQSEPTGDVLQQAPIETQPLAQEQSYKLVKLERD